MRVDRRSGAVVSTRALGRLPSPGVSHGEVSTDCPGAVNGESGTEGECDLAGDGGPSDEDDTGGEGGQGDSGGDGGSTDGKGDVGISEVCSRNLICRPVVLPGSFTVSVCVRNLLRN